jgi:hypothetical protein
VPETAEQIVEAFLRRMGEIRATGGATTETSFYGALETLLNAVGNGLNPKVRANGQLRNQGAGHPDFGLYTQHECQSGAPMPGQGEIPERGVVEVKGLTEEVLATSDTKQVSKYWKRYRLVLVTNYREFLLIGVDPAGGGKPMRLEGFSLAATDAAFWQACSKPGMLVKAKAATFLEYLRRALTHLAPLTRPADLAWLLASYARDALARVEAVAKLPALANPAHRARTGAWPEIRCAEGRTFLPLNARADIVLRHLFSVGAVVPRTEAGIDGPIRLACRRLVTACPHGRQSVRTGGDAEPSRPAWSYRGSRLDRCRARSRRSRRVLFVVR